MAKRLKHYFPNKPNPLWYSGFTLIELLLSTLIAGMLMLSLSGLVSLSSNALQDKQASVKLSHHAQVVMQRIVMAVRGTERLLLPTAENQATPYSESVRNVLAVTLDPSIDRNGDGIADADNDGDGRVDEDVGSDATNDAKSGIIGIDDNNDGNIDEASVDDDDEDTKSDEDLINGIDDDADGNVDEDFPADMNGDAKAGIKLVDDDGDGLVDEGSKNDDDEDAFIDEDWLDPVVFRLQGTDLLERTPTPGATDGTQFSEQIIAQNVQNFLVERLGSSQLVLLKITLTLTDNEGHSQSLTTQLRVGSGL